MGTEWDEMTHPYGDPRNSENAMEAAADRYRYILSLPIVRGAGREMDLLRRRHGDARPSHRPGHRADKLIEYARRALFDPLGVGPAEWSTDAKGEPRAASGGRMRPPDLLRVGRMVLADGAWQGKQIVPADWLKRSTTPVVAIDAVRNVWLALVSRRAAGRHAAASPSL